MEQTAINIIAIGIFSVSMSVLLGPVLNISPFIPAVTTLGILGLTTWDNLAWNGRGITLLLDFLAPASHRQRVIHHEAGHFLVAYFLGIPITDYSVSAWETLKKGKLGIGGVSLDDTALSQQKNNLSEIPLILERFCTVWMAGIAAEILIYGTARGGEEDRAKMRELLERQGLNKVIYPQKERWSLLQAKNLLNKYQDAYQALVKAMENRASVEECSKIMQNHLQ
jgi:hypothetical protein